MIADNIRKSLGLGRVGPSLIVRHPLQYANPDTENAIIDNGQYTGIDLVIKAIKRSKNETIGNAYCKRKKQLISTI